MSILRLIRNALVAAVRETPFGLTLAGLGILVLIFGFNARVHAGEVKISGDLGHSIVSSSGGKVYLRLSLKALAAQREREKRPQVNVALVLDRSGSMQGPRIAAAKEAAEQAISRLGSDDVVALVAYNNQVRTLHAASRLTSHDDLSRKIERLSAGGTTALYAGVKEGGRQVREYLSENRINRVILLSDGLANVGPSSPSELAKLGQELAGDGISVTTIGLGLNYNEDLMQRLALASDGNHAFAESPRDLGRIFDSEFGDTLSIAAQDIEIIIECRIGYKPVRILGRQAKIDGNRIKMKMNQLTGGSERYLVVELDAPSGQPLGEADIASVMVDYQDLDSGQRQQSQLDVRARISADKAEAKESINKPVMSQVAAQIATERNEKAVELRDKGDIKAARKLLKDNARYLATAREDYGQGVGAAPAASLDVLTELEEDNATASNNLDGEAWTKTRKTMRYKQHKAKRQQAY